MDLDLGLVSAVMSGGSKAYFAAKRSGITSSALNGAPSEAWKFIETCVIETGDLPSLDYFLAKTGLELTEVEDSVSSYIEEIRKRALWKKLRSGHESVEKKLKDKKPDAALEELAQVLREVRSMRKGSSPTGSLLSLGKDVLEYYDRVKSGERGVLTPWESVNEMTLGFWPGDFVVVVARMGVGKTFALLMMARHAWRSGKRVLFVGTEMSRIKLAMRFYSIHLRAPYKDLRRGHLGQYQEEEFRKGVDSILNEDGFFIVGDDFNAEMSDIETAIEEVEPDIVFIDGIYLVKNVGHDRHTRVSNTADDCKRLARRKNVPILVSHQFNREAGMGSKAVISATNVGITDVIGWNADVMLEMWQTDDMREDNYMGWKPLKLREGEGREFMTKWNFELMEFGEVDMRDSYKDEDFDNAPDGGSKDDDGFKDKEQGDFLF